MCRRSAPVPVVCTRQFSCDLGPRGRARGLRNCLSVMAPVHPPQVFWDTAPSFGSRRQNARIGVLRLGVSNHVGPSKLNRWKKLSKGRRLAPRGKGRPCAGQAVRAAGRAGGRLDAVVRCRSGLVQRKNIGRAASARSGVRHQGGEAAALMPEYESRKSSLLSPACLRISDSVPRFISR